MLNSKLAIKYEYYTYVQSFSVLLICTCQYWTEVDSWMVWGGTTEWFEVLAVGAVWGGR